MDALSGNNGGFWWNFHLNSKRGRNSNSRRNSQSGGSNGVGGGGKTSYRFPLKQAATAACLALTGDTIAQVTTHFKDLRRNDDDKNKNNKDVLSSLVSKHDWLRSLRMSTYGFFLYGPGSHTWYQFLDYSLPKQSVQNFLLKVALNQVVLGPMVIAVVFAWNNLWVGKLKELPNKYQKDALPTLLYGFRFWIPVSVLNFWLVPLQTRVGFMSTASIFWNFYLSSTMSK